MHLSIIKFAVIAIGSAFFAVLAMLRHAISTGEDPSNDGPRALIAEFLGLWIGGFFLIWSFTVEGKTLQWRLREVAAIVALSGLGLSVYFATTTEVPEISDSEPTGFKKDTTSLNLK